MRFLGFLILLVGLGLGYLYPLFQEQFTGKEFVRERVFDRTSGGWKNGWRVAKVTIKESDNPVRIRFTGHILSGNYFLNNTLPLDVVLDGADGTVLSTQLQINARENQNESVTNERSVQIATTEFGVIADGEYTLRVTSPITRDVNLDWMDAIFVSQVAIRDEQFRPIGLGMMMLGLALIIFGRRRAKNRSKAAEVKQEAERKKSRWGRQ